MLFLTKAGSHPKTAGFLHSSNFTGGKPLKNKELNTPAGNPSPAQKRFRIHSRQIVMGLAAFAYFFLLQIDQVLATDMWSKAEDIMKDVYGKILSASPPLPPS